MLHNWLLSDYIFIFVLPVQVQTVCLKSAETSSIFRKQILDKCQREFQKSTNEEDKIKDIESQLADEATEPEKKEQLKLDLEDLRYSMRKRSLGNIRFIGELYKVCIH